MLLHFALWKNLDVTVEPSGVDATRFVLFSVRCAKCMHCVTPLQDRDHRVYLGAVDRISDAARGVWGHVLVE